MRKLFLVLLLLCAPAWGQITVGTPTAQQAADCDPCFTATPTITAGSNRVGVLLVGARDGTDPNWSCTVGGQAMTRHQHRFTSFNGVSDHYILDANFPATGAQAISCNPDAPVEEAFACWVQIDGAAQQAPEAALTADGSTVNTTSITLTSLTDGALVTHSAQFPADRSASTASTTGTLLCNAGFQSRSHAAAYQIDAVAGSVTSTLTWATGGSVDISSTMAFAPAPVVVIPRPGGGVTGSGFWPPPYRITPQTLPDGEDGTVYEGADLEAVSGTSPFTWSVASGALPTGITLSSGGVLSGTPTEEGTFNFTAKAATALGGNAYHDFSLTIQTPPDPDPPEPWELTTLLDGAAVRTHYTSQSSAGSGDASSCANAESMSTAVGHYVAGDHHLLCGATYSGDITYSRNCTQAQPCVFRAVVDAAGDPVNARFTGQSTLSGTYVVLRGLYIDGTAVPGTYGIDMQATGVGVINTLVYDRSRNGLASFPYGPNMVNYGNTLHENGNCDGGGTQGHQIYSHSKGQTHGTKYVVQLISVDGDCPSSISNWVGHFYNDSSGTDTRSNHYHLQDSTFQDNAFVMGTNAIGYPDQLNTIKRNWFFDLDESSFFRVGYLGNNRFQGRVTENLFYNSTIEWAYWGAGSVGYTQSDITQFENNELINPFGGEFFNEFTTKTYTSTTTLGSSGAPKILDNTILDNNTYRIASGGTFHLRCNGTNHGNLSFANWKTQSDNCRVTPDAGDANGFDVNSTFTSTMRTVDQVECFDNFYQPGWGYCRAVNWDGNGSITLSGAEVDKIIGNGKTYKVRNARDFHGTPLETGTYTTGAGITVSPLPGDMISNLLLVWITSQP